MHLKVLQKESFKKQGKQLAICLVFSNNITNKITKVSKNLETVTNENNKKIRKSNISRKKAKNY